MNKNIFETGSSVEIIELISSVMMHPDDVGEDKIWVEYSLDFLDIFAPVMVWKRENENFSLNARGFFDEMNFENVIDLSQSLAVPENMHHKLQDYLKSLHGFLDISYFSENDENYMIAKQQHGYRKMILWKPLDYLGK